MMLPSTLLTFVIIYSCIKEGIEAATHHWTYTEDKWKGMCEIGKQQSPIGLSHAIAKQQTFSPFIIDEYFTENQMAIIKNNGHSVEARFNHKPKIKGGGLPETYFLDHLHFHWDSEHTINDIRFPLELHLVFYCARRSSLADALKQHGEVAVLSVLYYVYAYDYEPFKPLTNLLEEIQNNNKSKNTFLKIDNFLPRDRAGFYRYNGSLTTPDCTEGLIWTVFTNPIPISQKQVDAFRLLQTVEKQFLKNNYRPLQPLNERNVFLQKSGPPCNVAANIRTEINFFVAGIMTIIYMFM